MPSHIYSLLFVLYAIGNIKKCQSHYEAYTQNRYRFMMYAMDRELIKDSLQKARSIEFMKSYYARSPSFFIAERIFNIRRKFARMMRVYTTAYDFFQKQPEVHHHFYLQEQMIKLQHLAMDIDHLVEMLTEWEEKHSKNLINVAGFMVPHDSFNFAAAAIPDMGSLPAGFIGYKGMPKPPGVPENEGPPQPGSVPNPGMYGPQGSPPSGGLPSPGQGGAPAPGGPGGPGGPHGPGGPAQSPGGAPGPNKVQRQRGYARSKGFRFHGGRFGK